MLLKSAFQMLIRVLTTMVKDESDHNKKEALRTLLEKSLECEKVIIQHEIKY